MRLVELFMQFFFIRRRSSRFLFYSRVVRLKGNCFFREALVGGSESERVRLLAVGVTKMMLGRALFDPGASAAFSVANGATISATRMLHFFCMIVILFNTV